MNPDIKQADNMLKKIIETCLMLSIHEKRDINDKYFELVFYNKEIDEWIKIFTNILGAAVKPANTKPTKENLRLTEDYGGIYGNQTLFKKEFDDAMIIAMFWPWQDNTHTTLKIALLKK